ncbi:MAG: serine protease [Marmoricola sp.]|nr:serine protease [Marmoricola sp.]
MNENLDPTPPAGPDTSSGNTSPTPLRRPRILIPALVAALAVGAVGAGAGYAAGSHQSTAASAGAQSSTSRQVLQPSFGGRYGQGSSGGVQGVDPYGAPGSPYGGSSGNGSGSTNGGSASTGSSDSATEASGDQLTGLVRIATTLKYDGASAAGTGMVLTSDGEVVTNHHVVAGATSIEVKVMSTGKTYTAQVVGTDAKDDVAVLQLAGASGLDTVTPDSNGVTTGEAVTAVGDGDGTVDHLSAATGSVLARNQSITTQSEGAAASENLTNLMEISSDVVAGYSGGATYDADGQVVGMTTAASSGTPDVVGYAIPIAKVLRITDAIEAGNQAAKYDYGYPAFLGIALGSGTTVQSAYAGTPADDAGIKAGDQITSVGGTRTTTTQQLRDAISSHSPGDRVSITWTDAAGASHTATVTLATGPVE